MNIAEKSLPPFYLDLEALIHKPSLSRSAGFFILGFHWKTTKHAHSIICRIRSDPSDPSPSVGDILHHLCWGMKIPNTKPNLNLPWKLGGTPSMESGFKFSWLINLLVERWLGMVMGILNCLWKLPSTWFACVWFELNLVLNLSSIKFNLNMSVSCLQTTGIKPRWQLALSRLPKLTWIFEGSLEVKLPTIWTVETQSREESEEKRSEERRGRCAKR